MMTISKKSVWPLLILCLALVFFSDLIHAQEYSKRQLDSFNALTKDIKILNDNKGWFTAIAPLKPDVIPLFWGDHKAYTGGVRWPQNSYPPIAIASEYKQGRFVALGHDGMLIDPGSNDNFTANILNWLGNGYQHKKVVIYTHLGRWFNKGRVPAKAKEVLASKGVEIIELASPVSDKDLIECDLLIIVRPSKMIDQNQTNSIVSYVEQGGSLLMTGMGWFWERQNKAHNNKNFPLNKLGEHLGFEYSRRIIWKTPQNNKKGIYRFYQITRKSLHTRTPVEVKKYSIEKHSNSSINYSIAQNGDKYQYVVEGKNVMVSMPYRFFMKCRKPVDFIKQLDAVYEIYADLTDGIKPFNGDKIMILNVDNLIFHMSSGNPILSRQDRIEYIIEELEKSNYKNPSGGLMHELAHGFIIGMKHYFVFGGGDNESWAAFLPFYAYQKLGLDIENKAHEWKGNARAYHKSGERDFERIKNEYWLMIGFLHYIQEEYGWDVYKKLFKRYAELIRANDYPDFDETEKKVNIFVKELSLAAGVNFARYFKRWGFPVSAATNRELKHLPRARLFIN